MQNKPTEVSQTATQNINAKICESDSLNDQNTEQINICAIAATADGRSEILSILQKDTEYVPRREFDEPCWVQRKNIRRDGSPKNFYAFAQYAGRKMGIHVLALLFKNGELPRPGYQANHRCGRKACQNHSHIYEGTLEENARDAMLLDELLTGEDHPIKINPTVLPRGAKNNKAKLQDEDAAALKWCLCTPASWYTPTVASFYSELEALAVWFKISVPAIRRIEKENSWKWIHPQRPAELPFEKSPPTGEQPPAPEAQSTLNAEDVAAMRQEAAMSSNLTTLVADWSERLGVTGATIWNVLRRKTWKKIAPEIPPIDPAAQWKRRLPDRKIQQLRATYDRYKTQYSGKGLIAALARWADISAHRVWIIVNRLGYIKVTDEPTKIIDISGLEFKALTQRGTAHRNAKLNDEKVFDILLRDSRGEKRVTLARDYEITPTLVTNICAGKTWRHVWQKFDDASGN